MRLLHLLFGVTGYAIFFGTFLYLIGFVTGLLAPVTVDVGGPIEPVWLALAIDAALISLFGVQHAIMARPWFKRWLTRVVPQPLERTVFVLATCGVLALMFWQWRPIPNVLWSLDGAPAALLRALCFTGWGIVLLSTFLIDHFDLFGLRQVWLPFRGRPYVQRPFVERGLYRRMRHPLMFGMVLAFWAAPTMTLGHLAFAGFFSIYIAIGLRLEERDLVAQHGESYLDYRRRVRSLLPLRRGRPAQPAAALVADAG
ncbi:MAG: methanethiol S-methyltransferase [Planctomycetota bacterium]